MDNTNNTSHKAAKEPKLAYRGPELYEKLVEHARDAGASSEGICSSPDDRMEMLARRIEKLDDETADSNALYEVSIWVLLCRPYNEFNERGCFRFLSSAAVRGHESARFVTSKACLDGVPWAVEELRRIARNGNPFDLAREWLAELSHNGYLDARVELGSDLWERGRVDEAYDVLSPIASIYPPALVRLGIHQLPVNPNIAIRNLDKGEALGGGEGRMPELEVALEHT